MSACPPAASALAALLAVIPLSATAANMGTTSQDDFEAALRNTPQPGSTPTTASSVGPELSGSARSARNGRRAPEPRPIAPAGALPLRFRAITDYRIETQSIISAGVRNGVVDPFAMMEHLVGPLPIPEGARALRCRPVHDAIAYTLGVEASPEYMAALTAFLAEPPTGRHEEASIDAEGNIILSARASFLTRRASLAASSTTLAAKRRADGVMLAAGLERQYDDVVGRWLYRPGPGWRGRRPIEVVFNDDAIGERDACSERGISIPMGPTMTIFYE